MKRILVAALLFSSQAWAAYPSINRIWDLKEGQRMGDVWVLLGSEPDEDEAVSKTVRRWTYVSDDEVLTIYFTKGSDHHYHLTRFYEGRQ